jgi:AraC-like DNA-binding protein
MSQAMQSSKVREPSKATKRFVRLYVQREVRSGEEVFLHPVTARSAHLIDFEFGDPVGIQPSGATSIRKAEAGAVVGLQTSQRNQLLMRGSVESFVIFFQPAAMYQLFRLPGTDLVDCDHPVHAVLGAKSSELHQRLGNARTFEQRVQIVEQFVTLQSLRERVTSPIELAANRILHMHGGCRMDCLARDAGLGVRSLQRLFQQQIGVTPKLFARIVRFESALKSKALFPEKSWATIAYQFGYHDQMHMIHDFQKLSGANPRGILDQMEIVFGPQASLPTPDPDLVVL